MKRVKPTEVQVALPTMLTLLPKEHGKSSGIVLPLKWMRESQVGD
jgi:hypothetical protein